MVYFEIFKNKNNYVQPYWWVVKSAGNHQTLATSEMYTSKQNALNAINLVKANASAATVYDSTGE